jgi:hypothetical protein
MNNFTRDIPQNETWLRDVAPDRRLSLARQSRIRSCLYNNCRKKKAAARVIANPWFRGPQLQDSCVIAHQNGADFHQDLLFTKVETFLLQAPPPPPRVLGACGLRDELLLLVFKFATRFRPEIPSQDTRPL